jgi:hypothetical protein
MTLWLPKHLTPSLNVLTGAHWSIYLKLKKQAAIALISALNAAPSDSSTPTTSLAVAKLSSIASAKHRSSPTTTPRASKSPSPKPASPPKPKKAPKLPSKARVTDYRHAKPRLTWKS